MRRSRLLLVALLFFVASVSATPRYASLFVDVFDDADKSSISSSTCLDTVPLGECLFGTKTVHLPSLRFVNVSLARHVGRGCADIKMQEAEEDRLRRWHLEAEEAARLKKKQHESKFQQHENHHDADFHERHHHQGMSKFIKNSIVTLALPVGVKVPLREFWWLNRELDAQAQLNTWHFGRGLAGATLRDTPFDDYIEVQAQHQDGVFNVLLSSPRRNGPAAVVAAELTMPQSDDIASHDFVELGTYCAAITARATPTADAIAKLRFTWPDCSGHGVVAQFGAVDSGRWYSVVNAGGEARVVTAHHRRGGGDALPHEKAEHRQEVHVRVSEKPPPRCHQASWMSSLHCRRCSNSGGGGGDAKRRDWLGPCPVHLIEDSHPNRILDFELDAVCHPATCVTMKVFEKDEDCTASYEMAVGTKKQQQQDQLQQQLEGGEEEATTAATIPPSRRGKILTLPCGDVHDRDSTGSFLHNTFLSCNKQLSRLRLFGECQSRWCKATFQVPPVPAPDQDGTSTACTYVERGLLDAGDKHLYLADVGHGCATYGVRIAHKDHHFKATDSDRFASGTCIPSKLGGEASIGVSCVDWNERLAGDRDSNDNNNEEFAAASSSRPLLKTQLVFDGAFGENQTEFESNFKTMIGAASALSFRWSSADASSSAASSQLFPSEIVFTDGVDQRKKAIHQEDRPAHPQRVAVRFSSWRDLSVAHSLSHSQLRQLKIATFAIENLPVEFVQQQQQQKNKNAGDEDDAEEQPFTLPPSMRDFVAKYDERVFAFDSAPTVVGAGAKRWQLTRSGEQQQKPVVQQQHHHHNGHGSHETTSDVYAHINLPDDSSAPVSTLLLMILVIVVAVMCILRKWRSQRKEVIAKAMKV